MFDVINGSLLFWIGSFNHLQLHQRYRGAMSNDFHVQHTTQRRCRWRHKARHIPTTPFCRGAKRRAFSTCTNQLCFEAYSFHNIRPKMGSCNKLDISFPIFILVIIRTPMSILNHPISLGTVHGRVPVYGADFLLPNFTLKLSKLPSGRVTHKNSRQSYGNHRGPPTTGEGRCQL